MRLAHGEGWKDAKKLERMWGTKTERTAFKRGSEGQYGSRSLKADHSRWRKEVEDGGQGTEWGQREEEGAKKKGNKKQT